MSESVLSPTHEKFAEWVRDALNQLYDTPSLQKHPLAVLLAEEGPGATAHRSQNLRQVLLEAMRALRPAPGVPAQSPDWRAYRILELRYIEGLSPRDVMSQLALGKSQYFRDQGRVLEALTEMLWNAWASSHRPPTGVGGLQEACPEPGAEFASAPEADDDARENLIRSETERLSARATWETVDVAELLRGLSAILTPLAKARGGSVQFNPLTHLTDLRADRVMLRQATLNAITYTLDVARGGQVDVGDFAEGQETGIRIVARGFTTARTPSATAAQHSDLGLGICRQLMEALGGTLYLEAKGSSHWEIRLAWPVAVPSVLLAIDDNAGLIDLFRRYLAGHHWKVIGATDSAAARAGLAETRPTVIALDVMMPGEDGWEFLVALKKSADTRDIPVIVCSVLDEPQLALELGAAACLPKPVTQRALLQALAPWSRPGASPATAR